MPGWGIQPWGQHQWARPWYELRVPLNGTVRVTTEHSAQLAGQVRVQHERTHTLAGTVRVRYRPRRAVLLGEDFFNGKVAT